MKLSGFNLDIVNLFFIIKAKNFCLKKNTLSAIIKNSNKIKENLKINLQQTHLNKIRLGKFD